VPDVPAAQEPVAARPRAGADGAARGVSGLDAVRLLDAEPELAVGVPHAERTAAHRTVVVPGVRLGPGAWVPRHDISAAMGLLVVDGVVVCKGRVFRCPDAQLFGPGDFFDAALLGDESLEWRVLVAAQLAILDARLILAARRWPQLVGGITRRLFDGQRHEHRLAVIRALPRVEERLLALMADLAARWGHVTPEGLVVALPATHELLGRLVGARRPTVSLALAALKDEGLLGHAADGRWLLPPEAAEWPATGVPAHTAQPRVRRRAQARDGDADDVQAGTRA
jgi:CRP/FNR family transcriptional regulator, cyclic AMP receptor protein